MQRQILAKNKYSYRKAHILRDKRGRGCLYSKRQNRFLNPLEPLMKSPVMKVSVKRKILSIHYQNRINWPVNLSTDYIGAIVKFKHLLNKNVHERVYISSLGVDS